MKRLRLTLEGLGWLAAWRLARALPESVVVRGFEAMGLRSYRKNERRRAQVRANVAPVVPAEDLEATVRSAFRWYSRYWAETFRMQDLSNDELNARFRCVGCDHIDDAYTAGTGAVLATLHIGNWDAGGRWVAMRWPLTAVVEVLRPRMLFDRFVKHRRALGIDIVPLERGADATQRCLEKLAKGDLVALVADRDLSGSGIPVKMFGATTKLPPGPAVLALRSGAPLLPACIYQGDDGTWEALVLPPLPVDRDAEDAVHVLTQRLAEAFEGMIARAPDQWHVFSPYWVNE